MLDAKMFKATGYVTVVGDGAYFGPSWTSISVQARARGLSIEQLSMAQDGA